MKNSKERQPSASSHQNRLNKTQQPPQPKPEYIENSYQLPKKSNMTEKNIPSEKPAYTLPPRTSSSQKINYKVQDNMTHSKIQEAKQGLQLLKKKMIRTGMSRQKNQRGTMQKREEEEPYNLKKTIVKQQQQYGNEKETKKPTPQVTQQKSPPIPTKTVNNEDRPIKKQSYPKQEQYYNPNQEAPLKSNQDFMAILERQMAKENAKNQPEPISRGIKKTFSYDQEQDQEIQLVQCSKGCGRQFNINIIQKHEKVCEKVFQSKRKVFNSAAHRQPDVQDFKQPPPIPIREEKPKPAKNAKQQEKIPKWKLQSAAFRARLKQGRGQALTQEEKAVTQQATGMIQCGSCGRKFNQTAAKRHIPFCESKAKQIPKMNTTKKR